MARAVVLDAEALHALARVRARPTLAVRARVVLTLAFEQAAPVRIPSPILAEVCRDATLDAAVSAFIRGSGTPVVDLDARTARHAGRLLVAAKMSSAHAIDAFVVATAARYEWATIATGDPDDIGRLAARLPHVHVVRI